MKIIKSIGIYIAACVLSVLILTPSLTQASTLTGGSPGQEAFKIIVADRVLGAEGITPGGKIGADNVSNIVELLPPVAAKRETMTNVSTQHKAESAPECRKHQCQNGLTDKEWEQGFHMFILCFFVAPLLSTILGVIAGAMGWLNWLPWMRY